MPDDIAEAVGRLETYADWLESPNDWGNPYDKLDCKPDDIRKVLSALAAALSSRPDVGAVARVIGNTLGPHLAIAPTPRHEAIVREASRAILALFDAPSPAAVETPAPECPICGDAHTKAECTAPRCKHDVLIFGDRVRCKECEAEQTSVRMEHPAVTSGQSDTTATEGAAGDALQPPDPLFTRYDTDGSISRDSKQSPSPADDFAAVRKGLDGNRGGAAIAAREALDRLEARERELFDAIKHGDDAHRAWLKQAIEDHFAGRPVALQGSRTDGE